MKRVLFICRSNAGRSQTAEAFFKGFTKRHAAKSAGVDVNATGTAGIPPEKGIVEVLDDYYGIDISNWKRKQVTKRMLEDADKIVILMRKSERKKYLPDYFKKFYHKTLFWGIVDMRHTKSVDARRKRTERIRALVKNLVENLG